MKLFFRNLICLPVIFSTFSPVFVSAQATLPTSRTAWASEPAGWTNTGCTQRSTTSACTGNDATIFDATNDRRVLNFSGIGGSVVFKLKKQSMSGESKILVEQSANGSTYTTLGTYGTASGATAITDCGDITLTLAATTRYVRWTYTKATGNCDMDDVSVTCGTPSTQASAASSLFSSVTTTGMTISWTIGNGSSRLVFMAAASAGSPAPAAGTTYTASTTFGSGSQIGSTGWYCVYNGTGTTVSVTGLTAGTTYRAMVVEANCTATNIKYFTTAGTNNPANQATVSGCTQPSAQATGLSAGTPLSNGLTASWTAGDGNGTMIVLRPTAQALAAPVTGTAYTPDPDYGSAGQINTNNRVVFRASGNSVAVTGLSAETQYTATAYEYNTTGDCYRETGAPSASLYTLSAEPGAHSASFSATASSPTTVDLSFAAASSITNADGYMVLQKQGTTAPAGTPSDATSYSAGNTIGDGTVAAVVNNTSATSVVVTGLSVNTPYTFVLIPYSWNGSASGTYNYYTAATIPEATATTLNNSAPAISSPTATAITNATATLGANITSDGGEALTASGVVWAETAVNSNPEIGGTGTTNLAGSGSTGIFTVSATGLPGATQISYKAYATNSLGTTYTSAGTFTTLATQPTTPASSIQFGTVTTNSIALSWTSGNGARRIVTARTTATSAAAPANGNSYTVSSADITDGANETTGTGNVVVFEGTGSSVTVSGLTAGTSYTFDIYEYNGSDETAYYTAAASSAAKFTLSAEPSAHSTGVSIGSVTTSGFTISWTNGNGAGRLVLVKQGSAVDGAPADGTSYTAVATSLTGTQAGTGNYTVYAGTGSSVAVSGLTAGVTYHVAVFEYNGSGTSLNYYTTGAPTASGTTTADFVNLATAGTAVTQDMNMGTSGTAILPTGFVVGSGASPTFATGTTAATLAYGTTGTGAVSSASSGGTINWADGVTGSASDRALGFLNTGSFTSPRSVMVKMRNNTGSTVNALIVAFDYEKYRTGSRAFDWTFFYSTNGSSWTSVTAGDQSYAADGGNNAVNPATVISKSFALSSLSLANGSDIYFRWNFAGVGGSTNGQGIGVDDISVTPVISYTDPATVSGAVYDIEINSGTTSLTANTEIMGDLDLGSGTTLDLAGFTLTVNGSITGTGVIRGSGTSSLVITGSGAAGTLYMDPATPGTTNRLKDFTLNRGTSAGTGSVTFGNATEITGTVTLQNGTLNTGGSLTLVSDASGTARVAAIPSSADISGNVTVQRYIPAVTRRYRMLSPNVSGFTYADLIDDMFVTGAGGASNGFDPTAQNQASIYTYEDETAAGRGWKAVDNTANTLAAGSGALVFVRGDRTLSSPEWYTAPFVSQNAVTADFTGSINKGNVSPTIDYTDTGVPADDGWNLAGNPYPSQISWNAVTKNNLSSFYYVLNPSTGSYESEDGTNLIASGQAFFVQATSASPSLTFTESSKAATAPVSYFKSGNTVITAKMIMDSINSDLLKIKFAAGSSLNYMPQEDAVKFMNSTINFGVMINHDSLLLQYCTTPPPSGAADTFRLFADAPAGTYRLEFGGLLAVSSQYDIYLLDAFTGSRHDLRNNPAYPFSISTAPASKGKDRFMLVLENSQPLPVKLVSFTAERSGSNADLKWRTSSETGSSHFVLERKINEASAWETIAVTKAAGSSSSTKDYAFTDAGIMDRVRGHIYYRLGQADRNGPVSYYNEVILYNEQKSGNVFIRAYPNPAHDELLVQASFKGELHADVYDIAGKRKVVPVSASTHDSIRINIRSLEAGLYMVKVADAVSGMVRTLKFIKE